MKVDTQRHGTVSVVAPQDALTESTVVELRQALERDGLLAAIRLVMDMSHVTYLDSAGVEFLLEFCGNPPLQPTAARRRAGNGGETPATQPAGSAEPLRQSRPRESAGGLRPRLAGLTDTVREALDLTDALKRFSIFDSVPAAVRSYV